MQFKSLVFLFAIAFAPAAWGQDDITLEANPAPIVDAAINGRPVRLEVDPRIPDILVLNQEAADRLGVRRAPLVAAVVAIDGGSRIRGRIARPRITFGERASRALAGVFPVPMTARADGVIGPGALPFDVVTINLRQIAEPLREITYPVRDPDDWLVRADVGGLALQIRFGVVDRAAVLNRTAARAYGNAGQITPAGDLAEMPVLLGLSTLMQPVTTELALGGLAFGPTFARTNAPLLGAIEPDAIVVEAEGGDPPPASVMIGAAALERCASISVDRRARRLTLRCAA
jgi:hypothetical protein